MSCVAWLTSLGVSHSRRSSRAFSLNGEHYTWGHTSSLPDGGDEQASPAQTMSDHQLLSRGETLDLYNRPVISKTSHTIIDISEDNGVLSDNCTIPRRSCVPLLMI
jgi:hypothetical protein